MAWRHGGMMKKNTGILPFGPRGLTAGLNYIKLTYLKGGIHEISGFSEDISGSCDHTIG
jgi:hypothetical protein